MVVNVAGEAEHFINLSRYPQNLTSADGGEEVWLL